MYGRTNKPAALSRQLRKLLAGLSVTVKGCEYTQSVEVVGEIEALMSAREAAINAGLQASAIRAYVALGNRFNVLV